MHRNKDLTETVMYRFELMHEPYLCFDLIASLLNIQPILAEMGVACPTRNDVEFYDTYRNKYISIQQRGTLKYQTRSQLSTDALFLSVVRRPDFFEFHQPRPT